MVDNDTYAFVAEEDDSITVKLTELDATVDLGLYLVGDPCIEDNCLDSDSKKLTAAVTAGTTYYILVDGAAGAASTYKLELQCLSQCETQCAGKTCGPDGCGQSCGTCAGDLICAMGNCQEYGGFGWPCLGGFECHSGFCGQGPQAKVCTQECGDGACPSGWSCEAVPFDGDIVDLCVSDCLPECTDNECGGNGCGYPCGSCAKGFLCEEDSCVEAPCEPSCIGKQCGDDGCGGDCGSCDEGFACEGTFCQEVPCDVDCTGLVCGPSNCPGMGCGECDEGLLCDAGLCVGPPCEPQCQGQECGPDGCDGLCGDCVEGYECTDGLCTASLGPETEADSITVVPDEIVQAGPETTGGAVEDTSTGGSSSGCNAGSGSAGALALLLLGLLLGIGWLRSNELSRLGNRAPHDA